MISFFAKNLLTRPVQLLRCEYAFKYLNQVKRVDHMNPAQLYKYQSEKLANILKFRAKSMSHYSSSLSSYQGDITPANAFEILKTLPFLEKTMVREENKELTPGFLDRLFLDRRSTSGSTGVPCSFYKDRLATGYMQAVQDNAFSWHSVQVGEPQGYFWGLRPGGAGKVSSLKDLIKNRVRLSAFDLDEHAYGQYYEKLLMFRPTHLYGYPSLILDFARYLKAMDHTLEQLPLKVVVGTGEYINLEQRKEIEEVLCVPFVSEYGCTEVGLISFECENGSAHVLGSNIFLEVVDTHGQIVVDKEGEFVVTELNSRYLPFLRYRIGDRGKLMSHECSCGRSLPILEISEGRKNDYVLTPDGRKVYASVFSYTFKEGVKQFYVVQEEVGKIKIYFTPDENFNDDIKSKYLNKLKNIISPKITFEFVVAENIDRQSSGKKAYFKRLV